MLLCLKKKNVFPGINIVPVSEDNSRLQHQLMEKYFRPFPPQDSRGVKSRKSEMCDHKEKDHKHGKNANSKTPEMKHHHQNQGHHRHRNQQSIHQSDDDSHE